MNFLWDNIFKKSSKEEDLKKLLKDALLFQDLSDSELKLLECMVHVRKYRPNEPVFQQGEVGVGMYIVLKGRVEIYIADFTSTQPSSALNINLNDPSKIDMHKDIYITQLLPGDFFGELSLVENNGRRTASAISRDESILVGFFKPDFQEISARSPVTGSKIAFRLAEILGKRLKETTEKVSDLRRALKDLRQPPPIDRGPNASNSNQSSS